MSATRSRRRFGYIRKLPSGRFQASYLSPEGDHARVNAGTTFLTKMDAQKWLSTEEAKIVEQRWLPPAPAKAPALPTIREYADTWLANRDIRPRTRSHYRDLLDDHILPRFGDHELDKVSAPDVRDWHATVAKGRPTLRSHAYGLLRTLYSTALADDLVAANPCRIKGAGSAKRVKKIKPASVEELGIIASSVPPRYRLMVLLASWRAMRFGELTELRRGDVDAKAGVIHVRRAVTHRGGDCEIGPPKSEAGKRDLVIPPHLLPVVAAHLVEHTAKGRDALLFPPAGDGCHMQSASLYRVYRPARAKAGRQDLRFHDLRHTGATLAASTGATLAELMELLGQSTARAALVYQHAVDGRGREIAEKLSEIALAMQPEAAPVVDLATKRKAR